MTSPSDNPAPERRADCPKCQGNGVNGAGYICTACGGTGETHPQSPADAPSPGAQEALPLGEGLRRLASTFDPRARRTDLLYQAADELDRLQAALEAKSCDLEELTDEHKKLQFEFDDMLITLNIASERRLREAEAANELLRDEIARLNMETVAGRVPTWSYKAALKERDEALAANATLRREKEEAERQAKHYPTVAGQNIELQNELAQTLDARTVEYRRAEKYKTLRDEALARAERAEELGQEVGRLTAALAGAREEERERVAIELDAKAAKYEENDGSAFETGFRAGLLAAAANVRAPTSEGAEEGKR